MTRRQKIPQWLHLGTGRGLSAVLDPHAPFLDSRSIRLQPGLFEVVAVSVTGSSHQKSGQSCQDHFVIEAGADWVVAVVSDGAGSAMRALDGARIVSEEVCRGLTDGIKNAKDFRDIEDQGWREETIIRGIENARGRCLAEAREGEQLRSFHATVVGGIVLKGNSLLFHIGDGGASAHRLATNGIDTIAFSVPESGEYANETFFFTNDRWREHLRFTEIRERFDAVWLMTDGAYGLMVAPGERHLRDFTVSQISRLVFEAPSSNRCEILESILASPQAKRGNDDDKTLVIVREALSNGPGC